MNENQKTVIPRPLDEIVICQFVESLYIPRDLAIAMMMTDGIKIGFDTIWFQFIGWAGHLPMKSGKKFSTRG